MFTATKGILKEYGYEVVTLAGAGHEVQILPVNGFNLFAWTFEGLPEYSTVAISTVGCVKGRELYGYFMDGVHPNSYGNRVIAGEIHRYLTQSDGQ